MTSLSFLEEIPKMETIPTELLQEINNYSSLFPPEFYTELIMSLTRIPPDELQKLYGAPPILGLEEKIPIINRIILDNLDIIYIFLERKHFELEHHGGRIYDSESKYPIELRSTHATHFWADYSRLALSLGSIYSLMSSSPYLMRDVFYKYKTYFEGLY